MLSKQTTDQIRKEAAITYYPESELEAAFIVGAETWAVWKEKAEGLKTEMERIKKLEWSTDGRKFDGNHKEMIKLIMEIATKALESFNQNKVK